MNRHSQFAAAACVVLLAATRAVAQDASDPADAAPNKGPANSVTIYGLIDVGVEHINNVATGKTVSSQTRVNAGDYATSYIGFRGVENLGGNMTAFFNLEQGFGADTGVVSLGGRTWGRASYVGLEGNWGRLSLGRQYTMRFFGTAVINPFGVGSQGLTTMDNGLSNPRADNSVSYRVQKYGFDVGVNYSFGRDSVNNGTVVGSNCPGETSPSKQCREMSALLKYDSERWGLTSSYERDNGGVGTTFGGLTNPNMYDSRLTVGGWFRVGNNRFTTGFIRRDNEGIATPKSKLAWVMGTVPVGERIVIDGMLAQIRYDNSPNANRAVALRCIYNFSKRTGVYITADRSVNHGTLNVAATSASPAALPLPGGSQTSIITGIKHNF